MVAEREHGLMMASVMAHGGSFYAAAMDEPHVFGMYFVEHIRRVTDDHGSDVYPYAYGTRGAFLIMSAGLYGWWHDPDTAETHVSVGTDTNDAIVFGMDLDRLNAIKAVAVADGVNVVRCIRMDTNEECV